MNKINNQRFTFKLNCNTALKQKGEESENKWLKLYNLITDCKRINRKNLQLKYNSLF